MVIEFLADIAYTNIVVDVCATVVEDIEHICPIDFLKRLQLNDTTFNQYCHSYHSQLYIIYYNYYTCRTPRTQAPEFP
jgi:hypothetical protein